MPDNTSAPSFDSHMLDMILNIEDGTIADVPSLSRPSNEVTLAQQVNGSSSIAPTSIQVGASGKLLHVQGQFDQLAKVQVYEPAAWCGSNSTQHYPKTWPCLMLQQVGTW